MWRHLRRDIHVVFERDPACRSVLEVLLCYPGFHAVQLHRLAHALHRRRLFLPARLVSQFSRWLTGIEIHPGAEVGEGCFIDHGMGVVIGETTRLGENVTLYQGVTLGGTGKEKGKRHPTIGDSVVLGARSTVLGNITVGMGCKIGAGAVVVRSVPPFCTVVGVPGEIVRRDGRRVGIEVDLEHGDLPDPLQALRQRVQELEERLAALEADRGEERVI